MRIACRMGKKYGSIVEFFRDTNNEEQLAKAFNEFQSFGFTYQNVKEYYALV